VSEPDLRSADEAFAFVSEDQEVSPRYLEICDGQYGRRQPSLYANIFCSQKKGETKLGTKVESKRTSIQSVI